MDDNAWDDPAKEKSNGIKDHGALDAFGFPSMVFASERQIAGYSVLLPTDTSVHHYHGASADYRHGEDVRQVDGIVRLR